MLFIYFCRFNKMHSLTKIFELFSILYEEVTMAQMYISDPESDAPEESQGKSEGTKDTVFGNTLQIPDRKPPGIG